MDGLFYISIWYKTNKFKGFTPGYLSCLLTQKPKICYKDSLYKRRQISLPRILNEKLPDIIEDLFQQTEI